MVQLDNHQEGGEKKVGETVKRVGKFENLKGKERGRGCFDFFACWVVRIAAGIEAAVEPIVSQNPTRQRVQVVLDNHRFWAG